MIIGRRSFVAGLASLVAAPAIVRAESLMPIRQMAWDLGSGDFTAMAVVSRGTVIGVVTAVLDGFCIVDSCDGQGSLCSPVFSKTGLVRVGDVVTI